ncbi:MAG: D-glycero-beta-D-manno-heptose 1,7-bisphosphate 7-phosphatase [Pseudomonadota bacterium]|jgi:D-glycero-D-manno-heptose 1,7-bisphosphate phosphatase|uniref:D,D-heptose 1,7-bisphosphate phosphatase n=2 Tax=Methylophaga TaxID=40222 RepID=F5SZ70_9GAMM|nr:MULTISPECIES: D-glycero-beta-D-manno-heptose 1,7-bisphosphate 7-phosphatase [Methylophaga]MEC9411086.1 D-glycero-beta-D-manno-heptose 1,7-bisphosphate 7-phosphatase [Pseudomonadota bacterium]EGL54593.1 histidinol phosphatase and related phosphatase [Methylophaga aminisulfidivorans MP]WVI85764.1 D-glycero-beta-D-manno-heptose 1,7-bisphosphate 7-phosphatase [Methylophaga thalassica]GLQ00947.1 D,D-heptose 1,7-bisphosphate phosphatase [Methylophaga thalassica]HIC45693.1 D-glycero-beta-D-manno-h
MSLIILDRDGVINHDSDDFIKNPAEWEPIEGSLEAIARLNYAGYRVVVITNQSGIARGLFDVETLNRIHSKMRRMLAQVGGKIEAIMFCPHGPEDDCQCRKPQNGSFVDLAHRLRVNLENVPAVGDSLRDIQAAMLSQARPILVKTGKGERTLAAGIPDGVEVYEDLASVATALLERKLQ